MKEEVKKIITENGGIPTNKNLFKSNLDAEGIKTLKKELSKKGLRILYIKSATDAKIYMVLPKLGMGFYIVILLVFAFITFMALKRYQVI